MVQHTIKRCTFISQSKIYGSAMLRVKSLLCNVVDGERDSTANSVPMFSYEYFNFKKEFFSHKKKLRKAFKIFIDDTTTWSATKTIKKFDLSTRSEIQKFHGNTKRLCVFAEQFSFLKVLEVIPCSM